MSQEYYIGQGGDWWTAYNWCAATGKRLPTLEEALGVDIQFYIQNNVSGGIWTSTDTYGYGENVNSCGVYYIGYDGGTYGTNPSESKETLCVSNDYVPRVCPNGSVPYRSQCTIGVEGEVTSNISNAPCYVCSSPAALYGCSDNCTNYHNRFCQVTGVGVANYYDNNNYYNLNGMNTTCTAYSNPTGAHTDGFSIVYYSGGRFNYWSAYNLCAKLGYSMITAAQVNTYNSFLNQRLYTTDFWVDDGNNPASRYGSYHYYGSVSQGNRDRTSTLIAVCVVSDNGGSSGGGSSGNDGMNECIPPNSNARAYSNNDACAFGYYDPDECGLDNGCDCYGNRTWDGVICYNIYGELSLD